MGFQGEQQGSALSGQRQMRGAVPAKHLHFASAHSETLPLDPMQRFAVVRDGPLTSIRDEGSMVRAGVGSIDCRTPRHGFRLPARSHFFAVLGALG
ncbi:hypothetical protein DC522_02155 [Microvirga sp. KLBC 81]|nr:hypothetical protein DC522_02155 [Microvirga sp. KLBC 81]